MVEDEAETQMKAAYKHYQKMRPVEVINTSSAQGMMSLPSWTVSIKEPVAPLTFKPTPRKKKKNPVESYQFDNSNAAAEEAAAPEFTAQEQSLLSLLSGGDAGAIIASHAQK